MTRHKNTTRIPRTVITICTISKSFLNHKSNKIDHVFIMKTALYRTFIIHNGFNRQYEMIIENVTFRSSPYPDLYTKTVISF